MQEKYTERSISCPGKLTVERQNESFVKLVADLFKELQEADWLLEAVQDIEVRDTEPTRGIRRGRRRWAESSDQ
jgi:hypothetical protein